MVLRTPFRDRRWLVRGAGGGEMLFMRLSKMCVCVYRQMSVCARENTVAIVHALLYLGHILRASVRQTTHNITMYTSITRVQLPLSVGEGDVSSGCSTSVGLGVGGKSGDTTFKRGRSEPVGEIVL